MQGLGRTRSRLHLRPTITHRGRHPQRARAALRPGQQVARDKKLLKEEGNLTGTTAGGPRRDHLASGQPAVRGADEEQLGNTERSVREKACKTAGDWRERKPSDAGRSSPRPVAAAPARRRRRRASWPAARDCSTSARCPQAGRLPVHRPERSELSSSRATAPAARPSPAGLDVTGDPAVLEVITSRGPHRPGAEDTRSISITRWGPGPRRVRNHQAALTHDRLMPTRCRRGSNPDAAAHAALRFMRRDRARPRYWASPLYKISAAETPEYAYSERERTA